jgi:diguanylate cyclase (GGDEF)-like protein
MIFVFLASYRPVFHSLEKVIDAQLNQIQPIHELQVALINAVMPPNDYLIHGGQEEKQNWMKLTKEVETAFQKVFSIQGLGSDYDILLLLKKDWHRAKKQGDLLINTPQETDGCKNPVTAALMEDFDESVDKISVELKQLTTRKEKMISDLYSEIAKHKVKGLAITFSSIFIGILMGVIGSIWLTRERKRLKDLSFYDALTGILNRKSLDFHLSQLHKKQMELKISHFSILLIDIDKFKSVNDTFGHDIGDIVLKSFAETTQKLMRTDDVFGRFGGEEFLVLLPDSSKKKALQIAERIRSKISSCQIPLPDERTPLSITVSIGVSTFPNDASNIDQLFKVTDEAMYAAKKNGRNQVVGLYQ